MPRSKDPTAPSEPISSQGDGPALVSLGSALFKEVTVQLQANLGEVTLPIADILTLKAGAVVKLDASLNDLVELHLGQTLVAKGELVAVGDHFAIRIVEAPKP